VEHTHTHTHVRLVNWFVHLHTTAFVASCVCEQVAKHAAATNKIMAINLAAPFIVQVPPFRQALLDALPYCDFVFGNETEFAELGKALEMGTTDLKEIAAKIAAMPKENGARCRTVVITQGEMHTLISHQGIVEEYEVPKIPKEEIVDTNGAGDAWVGGFLAGVAKRKPLKVRLRDVHSCIHDVTCLCHCFILALNCYKYIASKSHSLLSITSIWVILALLSIVGDRFSVWAPHTTNTTNETQSLTYPVFFLARRISFFPHAGVHDRCVLRRPCHHQAARMHIPTQARLRMAGIRANDVKCAKLLYWLDLSLQVVSLCGCHRESLEGIGR
jgi:hypothetical protein